ncbi:MAG: efflux RND transporter permease subunit [Acidobacteriota bacterium]
MNEKKEKKNSGRRFRAGTALFYFLPFAAWGGLTVFSLFCVFRFVDFKPRINENFFFSSDDPQFQTDKQITKIFSQESEVTLSARGDISSQDYLRKVRKLTDELSTIPGTDTVQSLTKGPKNTDDAMKSPLWKRVLFSEDQKASFLYVFFKKKASVEHGVREIEKVKRHFESPDFQVMMSGAPYIVELISRNLVHDLKVFSIVAYCVIGLSGLLISRSVPMVAGTLIACTNAGASTLILAHALDIPIGPLTANLSTIVFVLTLTHMVFMTFNWRHIIRTKETSVEKAWRRAVSVTLLPSFLSMLTALLGFLSLLFAPATPLRQLGLSGAFGTVIAFGSAYVIYPFFLNIQRPVPSAERKVADDAAGRHPFFRNKHGRIVAAILLATAAASAGLSRLDTKPSLFSYFKKGGEIRTSLEYIDHNGGSIPLDIVLENPSRSPLRIEEAYPRLWRLHNTLERDPSVGSIVSLPLLLAEAKRSPLVSLIPVDWVLMLLQSPIFGKTAKYYITEDRTKTLFVLRMKESYTRTDHLANVERLEKIILAEGFEPAMVGGAYLLYGELSKLVAASMIRGLPILILLFVIMGGIISRSFRIVGAMLISLGMIPLLMLGLLGHLRVPVDIISAPAPNVAIGIGVDAMIHMLIWVRRHPAGSMQSWEAWAGVCSRLWKPILYSMSVVCAGFGIFVLSGFPPTQRFGFSVVLGTLLSPLPALFVLPWFATAKIPENFTDLMKRQNRTAAP